MLNRFHIAWVNTHQHFTYEITERNLPEAFLSTRFGWNSYIYYLK